MIRPCVPEHEQEQILRKCHSKAYGGHHAGDRTAHKVLQSGFYWTTVGVKTGGSRVGGPDLCV